MSAKKSSKSKNSASKPTPAQESTAPSMSAVPAAATANTGAADATAASAAERPFVPWIESDNPKRRKIAQVILVLAWVYVAALWLLALDQTFHWGIFGPKVPPLP